MALEIRLLGHLEILRNGQPSPLPRSRKTRALLAYLVATRQRHSRARLCELLWDGPEDPRAALRWSLTKIRSLLDEDRATRLVTEDDAVWFEAIDADVDLAGTVSKLYYMEWSRRKWDAYQAALRTLTCRVDGVERSVAPWPDWALTTVVDTAGHWETVWKAVSCHRTQMTIYGNLGRLSDDDHAAIWGLQEFYRVFSLVNGGRVRETDLFEGLR